MNNRLFSTDVLYVCCKDRIGIEGRERDRTSTVKFRSKVGIVFRLSKSRRSFFKFQIDYKWNIVES